MLFGNQGFPVRAFLLVLILILTKPKKHVLSIYLVYTKYILTTYSRKWASTVYSVARARMTMIRLSPPQVEIFLTCSLLGTWCSTALLCWYLLASQSSSYGCVCWNWKCDDADMFNWRPWCHCSNSWAWKWMTPPQLVIVLQQQEPCQAESLNCLMPWSVSFAVSPCRSSYMLQLFRWPSTCNTYWHIAYNNT